MKLMNWFLTTTMVLPGLNLNAQTAPHQHEHAALPAVKSETLTIDTKALYLNNASNSPETSRKILEEKRSKLSETHRLLGNFRDAAFKDMSQDYNLLNLQTGMTFSEEFQALKNKDFSVIDGKYGKSNIRIDIGEHIKPDLIHFMTWMRANGLATFKSLNANDPDGILTLETLPIANSPYKAKGPTYVVTKFKDVESALNQPEIFSVRNYKRMDDSVGSFMLANDKKEINHEHPWMRGLIDVKEMETRIRPLVRSILESELKSREYIKENPYTNKLEANIELVNDIARRVPAILTIKYFGFEGFTPERIMEWSRATQDDFFHNIPGAKYKLDAAKKAGQEMQSELVKLVDTKFKNVAELAQLPFSQQTILDRMVVSIGAIDESMSPEDLLKKAQSKLYLKKSDDDNLDSLDSATIVSRIKARIRTNLIGTLVGGLETTQAAISQTLNLILGSAELTNKAKSLAEAGRLSVENQNTFNSLVWEVLRFHPVNPVVFRYVEKDTILGNVELKAKSHIMIATQAAMFDPSVFPNPEALVLNRFSSFATEKYFHLGYGHHRCLGDYVSMVQVPEIIAGILALPNIRKMPGAFGELDFNKWTDRKLLAKDNSDTSFPEKMVLEYDSSANRPLTPKKLEIQDQDFSYEAYLNDYDRKHFHGCMSGWNITQDKKGELIYSPDGTAKPDYYPQQSRFKTKITDFTGQQDMLKNIKESTGTKFSKIKSLFKSTVRASQAYSTNMREEGNDMLYCRLPMKFQVCFESEAGKIKDLFGKAQVNFDIANGENNILANVKRVAGDKNQELRDRTELGDKPMTEKHHEIFNKCSTFADLTQTEKSFYENRYFGKQIIESDLSLSQSKRDVRWNKTFWHEEYFSAQDRYYTRGSYANPLGWLKMNEPQVIDFYVRLNFTFRTCVGDEIKKSFGKVKRCEAYATCVNGVYNNLTFKFEGALSPYERKAYNQIVSSDAPCEKD